MSLHAPDATPELDQAQTYRDNVPLPYELQDALYAACDEFGVGLDIMLGPIEVECGFDVNADNGICYGPCQLNRNYFPDGLTSGENIRAGVEYLGQLLARYNTVEAAPTAYNAGHDTGDRAYANAVLSAAEKWRA